MTSTVRLLSWSPGLKKISLAKLIRQAADMPLDEAHDAVNRLLAGEKVDVPVPTNARARTLIQEIRKLGAEAECVESAVPTPS
jgi:ribosomal protein L7/L12